ncbi:hypothetical protein Tco_0758605, partial [Tanacetum coccineum]
MQMISILKEEVIDLFVMGFRCFSSCICGLRFDVVSVKATRSYRNIFSFLFIVSHLAKAIKMVAMSVVTGDDFDATEIIRVLARRLITVAAMADGSCFFDCYPGPLNGVELILPVSWRGSTTSMVFAAMACDDDFVLVRLLVTMVSEYDPYLGGAAPRAWCLQPWHVGSSFVRVSTRKSEPLYGGVSLMQSFVRTDSLIRIHENSIPDNEMQAMMSLTVRRATDEAVSILAWQLTKVAAMADTRCVFKVFDLCLNLIIESGEEMLDMQNNQHTLCYDLYFDHVCWFIDPVEGFNIFNSSNTEPVLEESKESELAPQRKKEFNRKTKGFNILTIPGIKRIECKAHHNGPSLGVILT